MSTIGGFNPYGYGSLNSTQKPISTGNNAGHLQKVKLQSQPDIAHFSGRKNKKTDDQQPGSNPGRLGWLRNCLPGTKPTHNPSVTLSSLYAGHAPESGVNPEATAGSSRNNQHLADLPEQATATQLRTVLQRELLTQQLVLPEHPDLNRVLGQVSARLKEGINVGYEVNDDGHLSALTFAVHPPTPDRSSQDMMLQTLPLSKPNAPFARLEFTPAAAGPSGYQSDSSGSSDKIRPGRA